jgi:hypothetical protein
MQILPLDFGPVISIAKGLVMLALPFIPVIAAALLIGKKRR